MKKEEIKAAYAALSGTEKRLVNILVGHEMSKVVGYNANRTNRNNWLFRGEMKNRDAAYLAAYALAFEQLRSMKQPENG